MAGCVRGAEPWATSLLTAAPLRRASFARYQLTHLEGLCLLSVLTGAPLNTKRVGRGDFPSQNRFPPLLSCSKLAVLASLGQEEMI